MASSLVRALLQAAEKAAGASRAGALKGVAALAALKPTPGKTRLVPPREFEVVAGVPIPVQGPYVPGAAPLQRELFTEGIEQAASWGSPVPPVRSFPPSKRGFVRAPTQVELFPGVRGKKPTGGRLAASEEARSLAGTPDQALAIDRMARQLSGQFQRRQPLDIGLHRTPLGRPVERVLSPEDLTQEVFAVTRQRQVGLKPSRTRQAADETLQQREARRFPSLTPTQLDQYLYPKARTAVTEQVRSMTRPSKLDKAEQKILSTAMRLEQELGRAPTPKEVFKKLGEDPKYRKVLEYEGGVKAYGHESGVGEVLGKGLPSAKREPGWFGAREARPGSKVTPAEAATNIYGASAELHPLDRLIAAETAKQAGVAPGTSRLELALQALTAKQREAVIRVNGWMGRPKEGIREVARDLKLSAPTVHQNYKAGMRKLEEVARLVRRQARPTQAPVPQEAKAIPPDVSRWLKPRLAVKEQIKPTKQELITGPPARKIEPPAVRREAIVPPWASTAPRRPLPPRIPPRALTIQDILRRLIWEHQVRTGYGPLGR